MLAALSTAVILAVLPTLAGAARAQAQDAPLQDAVGQMGAASVEVEAVAVEGNQRLAEAVILAATGIRPGDTVTYRDVQGALRQIWATGQFGDVRVRAEPSDSTPDAPVTLVFEVEEQPYIGAIDFEGLEHADAGTVEDTVGLQTGQPLRPSQAAEAESMIRSLLADKGIRARSVEHRLEPLPERPGEHRLVFDVEEGQRVAITRIDFEGNEAFDDAQLREAMSLKEEGFLWFRDGVYREEQLRQDLRGALPTFYGEHGYIDFAVTDDSLVVDPESGKARVVIQVEEGPQYALANFDVQGNREFSTEELREYFDSERGGLFAGLGFGGGDRSTEGSRVFDRTAFDEATDQVRQLYRNQGYLYAQVQPVIDRTRTESGDPAVEVSWQVQEGDPAYVNQIAIVGNTYTHEDVIRERILLLPGDVYDEEALVQSYRRIGALGFFETPMPPPDIQPTEDGNVDVTFEVQEKQTGSINFGTAIGGWSGISGFLGYDQPNLFGQAKEGHLRWEYGRWVNNFEASYRDPGIMGSRLSGSASLFSTRGSRYYRFSGGQYRRTGGSLQFGVPLPVDPWSRLSIGYSLAETSYEPQPGTEGANFFQGLQDGLLSSLSMGLTRNTLNHPLFPTEGTRQSVQAEFNGGLLGGDGDFQKYTVAGNWWVPVGELGGSGPGSSPVRFALGLTVDAGALVGDRASLDRFPFERFWMGGVQYGKELRGYDETSITPLGYLPSGGATGAALRDRFGDAYLRMSAEYAVRFNDNLSLSLFYDAGNVWRDPSEINPTRLFRGAGLGVTVVTPFGPLGLDYAYGFDKPASDESRWQLHFKFGPGR